MPSTFRASTDSPSENYATLLWAGLTQGIRQSYQPAIQSFEHFCKLRSEIAWPASETMLGQWVAMRAYGSSDNLMGQLKLSTILSYFLALRSYHVDRRWNTSVFESQHILRLIQGARSLFPNQKRERLPITREVLSKITTTPVTREEHHIDAAFKLAFAGFLRMGEFTHTKAKEANGPVFAATGLTRSDLTFSGDHITLRLKRSKTDRTHQGVNIIVASTDDEHCPVRALRALVSIDPQPVSAPLFRLDNGGFPKDTIIKILRKRLQTAGIPPGKFSGHSFRRGAAQHARDNGILEEHIQQLGRWSSNAFRLYFETPQSELFRLNRTFQTGKSPPFSTQTFPGVQPASRSHTYIGT